MSNWVVDQTERFGGVNRAPRINPYIPGRTERLGTTSDNPRFSTKDIGKPVKLSGDTVVLCADGDLPYGFIEAVNTGTSDGYSIGTVLCDPGHEVLAVDEVGDLAVGDIVKAGTPTALATQTPALGAKVKKYTGAVSAGQSALLSSGGLAIGSTSKKAVKTANTVVALVGGSLVTKTTAETALVGTVAADKFNAYGLFLSAAGALSTELGTAGDTLAEVVLPQANSARALVGYVIVNPTGTGDFVGGTTDLDDATVVPNAVYVNTLGAVAQADQIAGPHFWQVLAYYGTQAAGKQVMLRKV
jgi:hypothetical protein